MVSNDYQENIHLTFSGNMFEAFIQGNHASGRDQNPRGAMWQSYIQANELLNGTSEQVPQVGAPDQAPNTSIRCTTWTGQYSLYTRYPHEGFNQTYALDIVELVAETPDGTTRLGIERAVPHRPVFVAISDPAIQSNWRMSIDHRTTAVHGTIGTGKLGPFTWQFSTTQSYTKSNGGLYLSGTITENTHWIWLSEIDVHLVQSGQTVASDALRDAEYDWGSGNYFAFRDMDANQMLGPGDRFVMDLAAGKDVILYDERANDYARIAPVS